MSRAERLDHTENLFWDLITAPEGVGPGLEELVRRGRAASGDLEAMIAGDARLPAADRLDIYANMYFFRLLDCLKEDYPRLLEAIGPDRFHNLATDYLLAYPSAHPSLRYLGARLPDFLEAHALGSEAECLVDLARLEWARADLFDAADAPLLTRDLLARLSEEQAAGLRLRLVPAFRLLRLDHDAPRLWRELRDRAASGTPAGEPVAGGAESASEHWAAGQANNARLGDESDARAPHACHVHDGERAAAPLPRQRRRLTAVRLWRRE
ncbi:MAG TPA: DNA-binding domain-containing protein, partial [Candidatus Polarisedimenticolia bacterium]|nr:DNA-binding domain-containing protein [Candidatus Polarisedimenticolia bacterium]